MAEPQKGKPDPWADDPSMANQQGGAAPPPTSNEDDWKVWQANGNNNTQDVPATDWLARTLGEKQESPLEKGLEYTPHTPEQGVWGNVKTGLSNIGAAGLHALTHPDELVTSAVMQSPPAQLYRDVQGAMRHLKGEPNEADEMAKHPVQSLLRAGEGAIGTAGALALPEVGTEMVPSRAHASSVFRDIENQAKNLPVSMAKTTPAVGAFRDYVGTGGEPSRVMSKLGPKVDEIPENGPMMFPRARDFYSNLSTETAPPGILRRAFEPRGMPKMRANLGGVKGAMNSDLTNAADTIGRGDDYTNALKEYAQNARLRTLGKVGAATAAAEVARRTGLLGAIAHKVAGQ